MPCLQVRLQTNRNQDMRMNGGRAETDVEYDIGFDDTGRIHALEIQVRTVQVSLLSWLSKPMQCLAQSALPRCSPAHASP